MKRIIFFHIPLGSISSFPSLTRELDSHRWEYSAEFILWMVESDTVPGHCADISRSEISARECKLLQNCISLRQVRQVSGYSEFHQLGNHQPTKQGWKFWILTGLLYILTYNCNCPLSVDDIKLREEITDINRTEPWWREKGCCLQHYWSHY